MCEHLPFEFAGTQTQVTPPGSLPTGFIGILIHPTDNKQNQLIKETDEQQKTTGAPGPE